MRFYLYKRFPSGVCRHWPIAENAIRSYLSEAQIAEAVEAKRNDPFEEVSFYIGNGMFVVYDY